MIAVASSPTPATTPEPASPDVLDRVLDAIEATTHLVWSRATDSEIARLAGLPNAKALGPILAELESQGHISIKRVEGRRLLCVAPRRRQRRG